MSASITERTPRVAEEAVKYVKPAQAGELRYGTAGFRMEASLLGSTCHRMGMLAVLRSKSVGKITGLMITASHNAGSDNGIKIVDPKGEMLKQSWEQVRPTEPKGRTQTLTFFCLWLVRGASGQRQRRQDCGGAGLDREPGEDRSGADGQRVRGQGHAGVQ